MHPAAHDATAPLSWPEGVVTLGRAALEPGGPERFVGVRADGSLVPLDERLEPEGEPLAPRDVAWGVPVRPSKVLCVGRNYRAHARELGNEVPAEPLLFLKPPSSLLAHDGAIELPAQSERVEHEGELAVVLGARLKNASPAQALAAVLGYTCANDVTARDIQKRENKFTRAKGFDTFCPLGPYLVREAPPASARVEVYVDDARRQHGALGDMVFDVATLLSFASHVMTLEPFDVVLTGTPEGVGPLAAGQRVRVVIDGVGTLQNRVSAAP